MSTLITPTLLNSFDFYTTVRSPEWKQKAFDDLLGTLKRSKPWEPTKAATMGITFEKTVYEQSRRVLQGGAHAGSLLFQSVVAKCAGGEFQRTSKYKVKLAGDEYVVYSKMDVVFEKGDAVFPEGHILDIKTTGKYDQKSGQRKYLKGWQHKIYCVSLAIPTFEYIVVEWNGPEDFTMADVHVIPVTHPSLPLVSEEINQHILRFVDWCKANENTFGTYTALTTTFSRK